MRMIAIFFLLAISCMAETNINHYVFIAAPSNSIVLHLEFMSDLKNDIISNILIRPCSPDNLLANDHYLKGGTNYWGDCFDTGQIKPTITLSDLETRRTNAVAKLGTDHVVLINVDNIIKWLRDNGMKE